MMYYILRYTIAPLTRVLFRVKIIGKKNLPKNQVYIMAANHNDNSDPVMLSMLTRKKICFLGHHYLVLPPNKIRLILRHMGESLVLIEKGKGKSQPAIDKAVTLLNQGKLFGIFPEGTTQGKEKILPAHRGVARIALKAKVPIIPIAIIGSAHVYEGQRVFPKRFPKVTINIGKPMYFNKFYGKENDRKITKQVADEVMAEVTKLYNQYYQR